MDIEQVINNITPDIHAALKRAIEIGKWPDGRALSPEQRELCMEAVISYEHRFVEERERVGYIDRGSKAEGDMCGDNPGGDNSQGNSPDDAAPIKWS